MRKTLTVAVAAATLITGMAMPAFAKPIVPERIAPASDAGFQTVQYRRYRSYAQCYPGERQRDCRERIRWERRHGGYYQWRNGRYYRRDNNDAAAAILGFKASSSGSVGARE